jgi:predicted murein hydrolase (TIGR00659 family)
LGATLGTAALFFGLRELQRRTGLRLIAPIVSAPASLIALLLVTGTDAAAYEAGARPLSWLLGPATVALAVPLYRQRALLRLHARAVLLSVAAGAAVGLASAVLLARALGLPEVVVRSLAPKSVTTPMAMPISEHLGGVPQLTAAIVVLCGVLGMLFGPALLDLLRVRQPLARGLAMGTASHGAGTARALEDGPTQGAASGVAMVIAGVVTALLAGALALGLR